MFGNPANYQQTQQNEDLSKEDSESDGLMTLDNGEELFPPEF